MNWIRRVPVRSRLCPKPVGKVGDKPMGAVGHVPVIGITTRIDRILWQERLAALRRA